MSGGAGFGQTFGSIDGETRDSTGAVVAGVTVSATNNGTNAVRTAVTNDAGVYSLLRWRRVTYTLRAEKPSFRTVVRNQVEPAEIQGTDGRVSGGVQPRGHPDQRANQVGHE